MSTFNRPGAALLIAVVIGAAVRLAVFTVLAPDFVRSRSLLADIAPGTVVHQWFDVRGNGLSAIRIDGEVTGGQATIDARLFERRPGGAERLIRHATPTWSAADDDCCDVAFDAVANSGSHRYALQLTPERLTPPARVSIRIDPVRGSGGLTLNGHPQRSNLHITGDAPLADLKGAARVSLFVLLAAFAAVDALVAAALYSLLSASSLRPS